MISAEQIDKLLSHGLTLEDAEEFQKELVECYFLGALEPEEERRVAKLLRTVPEMKEHLASLEENLATIRREEAMAMSERRSDATPSFTEALLQALNLFRESFNAAPAYAAGGPDNAVLFEGPVHDKANPEVVLQVKIFQQSGGLLLSATGPRSLAGMRCKITIRDKGPLLTLRPSENGVYGDVDITLDQMGMTSGALNPGMIDVTFERADG